LHEECERAIALDFPAIILNDRWFCSPDCATDAVEDIDEISTVQIFDPQLFIDRAELSAVSEDETFLCVNVRGENDVKECIDDAKAMMPGDFRPADT
jgi:hypothetical protein